MGRSLVPTQSVVMLSWRLCLKRVEEAEPRLRHSQPLAGNEEMEIAKRAIAFCVVLAIGLGLYHVRVITHNC